MTVLEGWNDLFPDVLLTCGVEIGVVGRPEIFSLGVLPVTFLTIGFQTIDVLLGILTDAWIVAIGARDDVFPILEFCPCVGTAAAVALKGEPTSTVAAWSSGRSIGRMATSGGITPHSVLGLTGVRTDDGVAGAALSGEGSNERLRETNSLT